MFEKIRKIGESMNSTEEKVKYISDKFCEVRIVPSTSVRVLQVFLYLLSISLPGIVLSCYYIFLWKKHDLNYQKQCGNFSHSLKFDYSKFIEFQKL
jgi:hypothetical protein